MDLTEYRALLYNLLALEEEDSAGIARGLQGEVIDKYRQELNREIDELKKEIDKVSRLIN